MDNSESIDSTESDTDSDISTSESSSNSDSFTKYTTTELKIVLDKMFKIYNIKKTNSSNEKKFCSHKNTKCEFISPCCGIKFKCSKCHDEYFENNKIKSNIHCIDTTKIDSIVCEICETIQPISNKCIVCDIAFSKYYCNICKVFGDSEDNFHCNKCGFCIVGNIKKFVHCDKCGFCVAGNKDAFIHCDKCGCCIEKKIYKTHKCMPDRLSGMCTICMDSLKNGDSVFLMRCGHAMHNQCYDAHIKNSYKCPECSKTIKDMKTVFRQLDDQIKNEPLTNPKSVNIVCNDCNKKSIIKYHYIGLKCPECKSYNTYKI